MIVDTKKARTTAEADAEQKRHSRLRAKEATMKTRVRFARARRPEQATSEGGTWTLAASKIADAEQTKCWTIMPPSYCALNDPA
jgi:uncharacterized lipoprotein NlpE involved in copper resistance